MGTTLVDERGRVLIPKEIRDRLGLRPNQELNIETKDRSIIISPAVNVKDFSLILKGCVRGSKVKAEDLKHIWGASHDHH